MDPFFGTRRQLFAGEGFNYARELDRKKPVRPTIDNDAYKRALDYHMRQKLHVEGTVEENNFLRGEIENLNDLLGKSIEISKRRRSERDELKSKLESYVNDNSSRSGVGIDRETQDVPREAAPPKVQAEVLPKRLPDMGGRPEAHADEGRPEPTVVEHISTAAESVDPPGDDV